MVGNFVSAGDHGFVGAVTVRACKWSAVQSQTTSPLSFLTCTHAAQEFEKLVDFHLSAKVIPGAGLLLPADADVVRGTYTGSSKTNVRYLNPATLAVVSVFVVSQ